MPDTRDLKRGVLESMSRKALCTTLAGTISFILIVFVACSGVRNQNHNQTAQASGIRVYGCGMSREFRLRQGESLSVSELLQRLQPLPESVNGFFLKTRSGEYFCWLSQAFSTNALGHFSLTNGNAILLVHRDDLLGLQNE